MSSRQIPPADRDDAVEKVVFILIAIALALPLILWRAWVFAVLWRWFVAPLGFDPVGVAHAIGLLLIVGAFLRRRTKEPEKSARQHVREMLESAAFAALALGVGWIASAWVVA